MHFSGQVRDRLLPLLLHLYTTRPSPNQEKSFEIHLLLSLTEWLALSTSIQNELQSMGTEAKNGQPEMRSLGVEVVVKRSSYLLINKIDNLT